MVTAIAAGLQVVLSIMGYFMKRANVKMETKKKFYDYVSSMADDQLASSGMKDDLEYQRKKILEEEKKLK